MAKNATSDFTNIGFALISKNVYKNDIIAFPAMIINAITSPK